MSVFKRRMRALKALVVLMLVLTAMPALPMGAIAAPETKGEPAFKQYKDGPDGVTAKASGREPKRLNVKWAPGIPKAQIDAAASRLGFRIYATSKRTGWTSVGPVKAGTKLSDLADTLRKARLTNRVEVEKVLTAATVMPNDPKFASQWSLHNEGQTGGKPDADIDAPEAWAALGTGSSNVTVAVIDTGVMRTHPDLKDNMWVNVDEIPGNGRDDDKNGYVDDRYGYDFYNYDESVFDAYDGDQHGTHVAGIIGATGNNGVGITGVNWDVTIMPVKFLGPWGGGDFEAAEAIVYAVDNGAKIINASWGGSGESLVLNEAIDYAAEHGVLMVCAAGNWGEDQDALDPDYRNIPSSYESTAVVAVAATDHNDELADFSNFGAQFVDIAAPGVDVNSTLPSEATGFFINDLPHKIVYLPFVLEALEPAAARDQMIVKSVQKLGGSVSTSVLVVDDSVAESNEETPGERAGVYTKALADAGFTKVSVWNTETQGAPTTAAMRGKLVIWFTGRAAYGWDEEESVNSAERAAITAYLNSGGRLLMASGELATDMEYFGADWEWFEETFHCMLFDLMTWSSDIKGKTGGPFEGIEVSIPAAYQDWETEFAPTGSDAVVPLDDKAVSLATIGGYGELSGTSMAAPTVTGAAALLMSALPGSSAEEIRARLENTGDHLASLEGKCVYESRINVSKAFSAYAGRPIIEAPRPGSKFHADDEVEVKWRQPLGADPAATYEVQYGLPYILWSEDFESGDLGSTVTTGEVGWHATDDPAEVRSGDWGARSGDVGPGVEEDGWIIGNPSTLSKTITMPDGGGKVGFWWWWDADDWETTASFWVDGRLIQWPWEVFGWTYVEVPLSAGEHTLDWSFYRFMDSEVGRDGMGVDDIKVTAYEYTDIATNEAGDLDATWIAPWVDTDDAQVRVRAQLGDSYSPWAYSKRLFITTDFLAPSAPNDFMAETDGDGGVHLDWWTNPADIDLDRVKVLARTDAYPDGPSDPQATVVYEGAGTSVHDALYADGTTVYYSAFAVDFSENWSEASQASVTVVDEIAPQAVSMLTAEMVDGLPAVSWMNPDSTFSSVKVLRRTDGYPTGPNDPAATLVYNGTGAYAFDYLLAEQGYQGPAYYSVWVTDPSGNISDVAQATVEVDTSMPEGEFYLNDDEPWTTSALVTANAYVDGATQMRLFANGEIDEDAPWVPFDNDAKVQLLNIEGMQSVTAQFRGGNGVVVEFYDEIYVNINAPAVPTGLQAESLGSKIRLTWDEPNMWPEEPMFLDEEEPPFDEDVPVMGYNVYVSTSASGPFKLWMEEVAPIGNTLVGGLKPDTPYWLKITAVDYTGLESGQTMAVTGMVGEAASRVSGANRFATSAAISAKNWTSADTVVIATGLGFADALGASPLAGYYDAPVLLVQSDTVPAEILAEVDRLDASNAIIVGGIAAVSSKVETALENAGVGTSRIAGANRYETAALCAHELAQLTGDEEKASWAFVVSGQNYADALAVAPIAFANKIPVLLTARDVLPDATWAELDMLAPDEVFIVGGKAAVSNAVEDEIGSAERIAGPNRYATAAEVMYWAVDMGLADPTFVGIASSASFADGLCGGAAMGRRGGVMLFSAPTFLPDDTFMALLDFGGAIGEVQAFGGPSALSQSVLDDISIAVSASEE